MWTGCLTALITPFRNGAVDYDALGAIVEAQIAGGVDGLVPCGSTGESATLTHDEHAEVVGRVVQMAKGRVPVIVTTTHFSSRVCAARSRRAQDLGAAMVMVMPPYHGATIRATEDAIFGFFDVLSRAIGVPVPAHSASLDYFDSYRTADLPANLTQGQRDYFGAHTYQRTDREGIFHTEWAAALTS